MKINFGSKIGFGRTIFIWKEGLKGTSFKINEQ